MTDIIDFNDAVRRSIGPRHLLMGNGFSVACHREFSYKSLYDVVGDFIPAHIRPLFSNTVNFEAIMSQLSNTKNVVKLYGNTYGPLCDELSESIQALRKALVDGILSVHPLTRDSIAVASWDNCSRFLQNFHLFFTTNYDLLLYWAFDHEYFLKLIGGPHDGPDNVMITPGDIEESRIHYMHGAIHLYPEGTDINAFSYAAAIDRGRIGMIQEAARRGVFPVIITEGTSEQKYALIKQDWYLKGCYNKLRRQKGSLFVYGFSASHEHDNHILRAIADSNIQQLIVGVYQGPGADEEDNWRMIHEFEMIARRKKTKHLDVIFYDAESAQVWR